MNRRRRAFIKMSSTVLAGAVLLPGEDILNLVRFSAKERLGVALVGLGYYSTDVLAPALQRTQHCYLAGIVTGSPHKVPVWQQRYGIKDKNVYNYENMSGIANNDEIDIVYIVLPTGLHSQYGVIAANAGKHVWCEKPMARTAKECAALIEACRKNKVKLSIGYRMQHEPNTQTIMKWAVAQPYGRIQNIYAAAGYYDGRSDHWKQKKTMGGGALYDMGVYPLNAMRYSSGKEPLRVVSARHETTRPAIYHEVDETTYFQLEFPGGSIANGATSLGKNMNELRINCENGWYELKPFQSYSGIRGRTSDGKVLNKSIPNQQAKQMDDDALAILNNTEVLVPGEEGLKDIRIVEAIFQSAASGRSVEL